MFITTFIHVLEVAVILLVGLTAFQVHRCYQAFNEKALFPRAASPSHSPSVIKPITQNGDKPLSAPESILHDYIGEFFMDVSAEAVANIDAYKVNKHATVESVIMVEEVIVEEVDAPVRVAENQSEKTGGSNVVNFDERSDISRRLEILVEEEDDSVITVMTNSKSASRNTPENVMSDKVVHAMLDEAKLVCVS